MPWLRQNFSRKQSLLDMHSYFHPSSPCSQWRLFVGWTSQKEPCTTTIAATAQSLTYISKSNHQRTKIDETSKKSLLQGNKGEAIKNPVHLPVSHFLLTKLFAWCEVCIQCCSWRWALEWSKASFQILHPFNFLSTVTTTYSASHALEYMVVVFDTDSFMVGVHYVWKQGPIWRLCPQRFGKMQKSGGVLAIAGIGTLALKMDDNNSRTHLMQILNSIYVPDFPITLLCPQH